jgi:hypothetical protein
MEIIRELSVDKWGIWIDTYFFDFYLHTRTIITALLIGAILRTRKVIKDKKRKS